MAFRHGKSTTVLFNTTDLSAYLNSVDHTLSAETAETTTFGDSAKKYIVGLRDGTVSFGGFFDGSAAAVDEVLSSAIGTEDSVVSVLDDGNTIGSRCLVAQGHDTSYQVTGAVGDAVSISAEMQLSGGLTSAGYEGGAYRGVVLADFATRTGTGTSLTAVDNGAGTTNGLVANLHLTANTVNSIFTIYHSVDNVTWAVLLNLTLGTTAPLSVQLATAPGSTVNRYLRLTWSGASGSRTFAVTAARR